MKKHLLNLLFLIFTAHAFAQQTQFNKFIKGAEIEWAAYIYDTPRFEHPNFNKLITGGFQNEEVKGSFEIWRELNEKDEIKYVSKKEIDNWVFGSHACPSFDSSGKQFIDTSSPTKLDSASFNVLNTTQIIYIEDGYLKSYVPYVSPALPAKTEYDYLLGYSDYFTSCFNFDHNYKQGSKDSVLFLGRSKKTILVDSIQKYDKLKELYGRNLIQALWPYLLQGKFTMYLAGSNKKIQGDTLVAALNAIHSFKIVDSATNNIVFGIREYCPLEDAYSTIELTQDWYYDHTNNIVFTKIISLKLYARLWPMEEGLKELYPPLTIIIP